MFTQKWTVSDCGMSIIEIKYQLNNEVFVFLFITNFENMKSDTFTFTIKPKFSEWIKIYLMKDNYHHKR